MSIDDSVGDVTRSLSLRGSALFQIPRTTLRFSLAHWRRSSHFPDPLANSCLACRESGGAATA